MGNTKFTADDYQKYDDGHVYGRVRKYDPGKGYGFIFSEYGKDIFSHLLHYPQGKTKNTFSLEQSSNSSFENASGASVPKI